LNLHHCETLISCIHFSVQTLDGIQGKYFHDNSRSLSQTFRLTVDYITIHKGVSKSFWTGHLQQEWQMVQLCATRHSCIAILWVSLVSFAAITLCVASQWAFIVVVYFIIDSVRKLLDTPS
jgi:hypothetical protein